MKKEILKNSIKRSLVLLFLAGLGFSAQAQLNPMGSAFYLNPYLANPARAGISPGFELNGGYKAQWTNVEGAPQMQSITATYGSENKKVGLGLSFYNEGTGIIRKTSYRGTFAYHLPLNSESSVLDFGISAGLSDEWVDINKVNGNRNDANLGTFNQRKAYFDGDFGIAFRNREITVEAALPNLKHLLNRDVDRTVVERPTYYASASYKFTSENGVLSAVEPKISYRGIQDYRDIFDFGVNTQFLQNKLTLSGIYHSTNSISVGLGTTVKNSFSILAMYTTNTSAMQNYSNGEFEVGLKYSFK